MTIIQRIQNALFVSAWFTLLAFPILGLRFDMRKAAEQHIFINWERLIIFAVCTFFCAIAWKIYFDNKAFQGEKEENKSESLVRVIKEKLETRPVQIAVFTSLFAVFAILPVVSSLYQVTIFSLALIYIMLALGLNIVVGIAGQLVLGYSAFYAVGAYTYALLNMYFGLSFWVCLPLGGLFAAVAGIALGFPVLRLRGDYLAIVTLGFGEITRLLLTNLSDVTMGARGISNIPRPSFFGMEFTLTESTIYIYYVALASAMITIIVVGRLKNSRVGLALQAMKEDEIASESMGINLRKTKLMAFALGSCWAGFAGVILAARNSFINPASFTFMDSAMVLAMVVLGGMGSIWGVVLAALLLTLLPEYLRTFSEYRMLIFGALMVLMMIFRPQGMVPSSRRKYKISPSVLDK